MISTKIWPYIFATKLSCLSNGYTKYLNRRIEIQTKRLILLVPLLLIGINFDCLLVSLLFIHCTRLRCNYSICFYPINVQVTTWIAELRSMQRDWSLLVPLLMIGNIFDCLLVCLSFIYGICLRWDYFISFRRIQRWSIRGKIDLYQTTTKHDKAWALYY